MSLYKRSQFYFFAVDSVALQKLRISAEKLDLGSGAGDKYTISRQTELYVIDLVTAFWHRLPASEGSKVGVHTTKVPELAFIVVTACDNSSACWIY